jgi:methylglutaconyl-CoA hydratase
MYAQVFSSVQELEQEIKRLSLTLAASNPEAMAELKKVFWKGTENWDTLLIERAEISGRLVISDFTVKAINKFKSTTK